MATPLRILIAAADDNDLQLLKRAFSRAHLKAAPHFVRDGQEVLEYLEQKLPLSMHAERVPPDLLLLDLNLHRVDGFGVLAWLKQQSPLNRMLVLVFSTSETLEEVRRAYDLGADIVVLKPRDLEGYLEVVHQVEQHWLRLNATPECGGEGGWDS